MTSVLKNKEDFEEWLIAIKNTLRSKTLAMLISDLPKPSKAHEQAEQWMVLSLQISQWMQECTSPKMYRMVTSVSVRTDVADSFLTAAATSLGGRGPVAGQHQYLDLVEIKRSDYSTELEFAQAFQAQFTRHRQASGQKPPNCVTFHSLLTIQATEINDVLGEIECVKLMIGQN